MTPQHDPALIRDQELLIRLRNDDLRAWNEVYEAYRGPLTQFLLGKGVQADLIPEIYQETFIRLDAKIQRLELTRPLLVYLKSVAFRVMHEFWRQEKALKSHSYEEAERLIARKRPSEDDSEEVESGLFDIPADEPDLTNLDTTSADALVQEVLDKVQLKHCADIFRLRYWNGMDDSQIAAQLKIAYDSVRKQFYDCRKKAKNLLISLGWGR